MSDGRTRELTRREMLKLAAGFGLAAAAGDWIMRQFAAVDEPNALAAHNGDGPHWIMTIDLDACIGCYRCVYACQATNDTAGDHLWNILVEDEETFGTHVFLTRPCMHCEHAPCVEVCPVNATFHDPDTGLVQMNYDRCIGCRYCMVACPYGVRVFNWEKNEAPNPRSPEWGTPEIPRRPRGVAEKCTFCEHRLRKPQEDPDNYGEFRPGYDPAVTPACCVICPTGARRFGDMRDLESPASVAMQGRQAVVLRDDLGTNPRVYYLLPT
jgi:Fe-S-cluster-containing dehydrogenase component